MHAMWRNVGLTLKIDWDMKAISELPYRYDPFNDPMMLEKWAADGYRLDNIGGLHCDERHDLPRWAHDLKDQLQGWYTFKNWQNASIAFFKMNPGMVLPTHTDTYENYMKYAGIDDRTKVMRAIIFPQEWKSGHYFEIDNNPVVSWNEGRTYIWKSDVPHMAGNFGNEPRYTIQLTGHVE